VKVKSAWGRSRTAMQAAHAVHGRGRTHRIDAVQGQGGGHLRPRSPTASDGRLQRLVLDTGRAAASRSRHARTRQ
jgi:hypothetical protein